MYSENNWINFYFFIRVGTYSICATNESNFCSNNHPNSSSARGLWKRNFCHHQPYPSSARGLWKRNFCHHQPISSSARRLISTFIFDLKNYLTVFWPLYKLLFFFLEMQVWAPDQMAAGCSSTPRRPSIGGIFQNSIFLKQIPSTRKSNKQWNWPYKV